MALKKAITVRIDRGLDVELNYHRIALLNVDVNNQITVLCHSYRNENDREYEKSYARGEIEGVPTFPFVYSEYLNMEYEDDMNVKKAYEWLKTQPGFEGAEDV